MDSQTRRAVRGTAAAAAATALMLASAGGAHAEDAREDALERRVIELERQLDELRDARSGSSSTELEARVAELEKASKVDKDGLFPYWKTGLRADAANKKKFNFKFGGRIMNDYVAWDSDDDTEAVVGDPLKTSTEFRRARLYFSGTVYENVFFKAQYDFAGGDADFKDVYVGLKALSGKVTVGHQYMPFGLQERTSSKYITFMERAPHQVFGPSRKTGFTYTAERDFEGGDMWYGLGMFRQSDGFGDDTDNSGEGEWNYAGRFSVRPWVDEENQQYLSLGASGAFYNFAGEMTRVRARPQVHTAPRFVDTGTFAADEGSAWEADAAFSSGPFHAMVEWMGWEADSDDSTSDDPEFDGLTAQAGFFLTGEHRPWKGGKFDRVKPKHNYDGQGGTGAWEVAARWSTIDLDDGGLDGGQMDIWSVGLNWYLNPNTRVMINWENIDLDRDDGTVDADDVQAIMMRFQIDF